VQFLASNYVSPQLADIGAALAGAAALVALPQTRRPVPERPSASAEAAKVAKDHRRTAEGLAPRRLPRVPAVRC
jgi:hypothetical protein